MAGHDLVGFGAGVVDKIFQVDSVAAAESKVFIRAGRAFIGGVVPNHLAWAGALGLRPALFGVAADDEDGRWFRRGLKSTGVADARRVSAGERTSSALIFVDPEGERAVYLDRGSNPGLRPDQVAGFGPLIRGARFVSTELCQLPLPAVQAVLDMASAAGKPGFVDLDLPPSAIVGSRLGTRAQVLRALRTAPFVKSSVDAAAELVGRGSPERMALALHGYLKKRPGTEWVALTAGRLGSAISDGRRSHLARGFRGIRAVDSTGAGDAYLGGLIAGTARGFGLAELARFGNAAGAAKVERLGAGPGRESKARVLELFTAATASAL